MSTYADIIERVVHPAHFFAGSIGLEWEYRPQERVPWETYQGRLLDVSHCRQIQSFTTWNIWQLDASGRSGEPLLSIKLDEQGRQVHIVRAIYSYAWEAYQNAANVILSRETKKWLRELVGTLHLDRFADVAEFGLELADQLFRAVVGLSRLPLTSLEAPLPDFVLGRLAYFPLTRHNPAAGPMRTFADLMQPGLHPGQDKLYQAKLLETLLRSTPLPDMEMAVDAFLSRWQTIGHDQSDLHRLLLTVFDEVSLSPFTDFVDRAVAFAASLESKGYWTAANHADFLAAMLRRLGRHLTAFDLITFHHRGANYPDALLLDALLEAYRAMLERRPDLFADATHGRLRRRALRQAWLLRRHYEGLPVPDLPTSEGENARVLPDPRIPAEQIQEPSKRTRRLYAGASLKLTTLFKSILAQSIADLSNPAELMELGTALFLDRPLGYHKQPGEPDLTPLLSYAAFSKSIAAKRLGKIRAMGHLNDDELNRLEETLKGLDVHGLAISPSPRPSRIAFLADALKVAGDFIIRYTTRTSLLALVNRIDWHALQVQDWQAEPRWLVVNGTVVGDNADQVHVYDGSCQARFVIIPDWSRGTSRRQGMELPVNGFHLVQSSGDSLHLPLRERQD